MKSISIFCAFVFAFVLIQPSNLIAQSSKLDSESFFVQETIGDKFDQFTYQNEDMLVVFRNDRIEIVNKSHVEKPFFFIKMNNVQFESLEGEGLVKKETVENQDKMMSQVLGSDKIDKAFFNSIKYKESNSGREVVITIKKGKIDFSSLNAIPLELEILGNQGLSTSRKNAVELEEFGKIISINSKNSDLNKKNNLINFIQQDGDENANLQFSLSIN